MSRRRASSGRRHSASDRRTFFFFLFLLATLRRRRRGVCFCVEPRDEYGHVFQERGECENRKVRVHGCWKTSEEFEKALDDICA